jgi:hypothetical protein
MACLDNRDGMTFNHRRQSQDTVLCQKILDISSHSRLWIAPYSHSLFPDAPQVNISEDYLLDAGDGDYCFAENPFSPALKKWIEKIIIFRWNRDYPFDTSFPIPLNQWHCTTATDFIGSSHNITMETYFPVS